MLKRVYFMMSAPLMAAYPLGAMADDAYDAKLSVKLHGEFMDKRCNRYQGGTPELRSCLRKAAQAWLDEEGQKYEHLPSLMITGNDLARDMLDHNEPVESVVLRNKKHLPSQLQNNESASEQENKTGSYIKVGDGPRRHFAPNERSSVQAPAPTPAKPNPDWVDNYLNNPDYAATVPPVYSPAWEKWFMERGRQEMESGPLNPKPVPAQEQIKKSMFQIAHVRAVECAEKNGRPYPRCLQMIVPKKCEDLVREAYTGRYDVNFRFQQQLRLCIESCEDGGVWERTFGDCSLR